MTPDIRHPPSTNPGIMFSKGNHPQIAELFRLVTYYLVVWNIWIIFPYIGNFIIPIDVHSIIFHRGRLNHQLWFTQTHGFPYASILALPRLQRAILCLPLRWMRASEGLRSRLLNVFKHQNPSESSHYISQLDCVWVDHYLCVLVGGQNMWLTKDFSLSSFGMLFSTFRMIISYDVIHVGNPIINLFMVFLGDGLVLGLFIYKYYHIYIYIYYMLLLDDPNWLCNFYLPAPCRAFPIQARRGRERGRTLQRRCWDLMGM